MALLLGSSYAIEMCKPSLCNGKNLCARTVCKTYTDFVHLTLVMMSAAAGLCQSLGFHRYSSMKDDSEEDRNCKIHVFWMIYMFDKTMSLRLGRASIIQDFDIELPFLEGGASQGREMLAYWVKVARVQGQTYEKLFSPAAFLRSPEERTRIGKKLQFYLVHWVLD
jgi:hypothetical protein